jgi:hypothetical protein
VTWDNATDQGRTSNPTVHKLPKPVPQTAKPRRHRALHARPPPLEVLVKASGSRTRAAGPAQAELGPPGRRKQNSGDKADASGTRATGPDSVGGGALNAPQRGGLGSFITSRRPTVLEPTL